MKHIGMFALAAVLAPIFAIVIGFSVGFGAALSWLAGSEE